MNDEATQSLNGILRERDDRTQSAIIDPCSRLLGRGLAVAAVAASTAASRSLIEPRTLRIERIRERIRAGGHLFAVSA